MRSFPPPLIILHGINQRLTFEAEERRSAARSGSVTPFRHLVMASLTVVSLPVKSIVTISRNIWLALCSPFSCCCSNQTRHESRRLGISGLIDISGNVTDCIHRRAAIRDTPIIRNISLIPHPFLWREFTSAQRWSRFSRLCCLIRSGWRSTG